MQRSELSVVCDALLARIFQRGHEDASRGFIVAITSAHPQAGVSHISNALAMALNQGDDRSTMLLSSRYLKPGDSAVVEGEMPESAPPPDLWQWHKPGEPRDWHGMHASLAVYLENLRRDYQYILIDCPSLREAEHAVILASLVDGVVLVVEANRTQKDQFLYAEQAIENAGGRILGHVLNKRTYVIPDWLHRRMESVGL
jgi:Mrp family chromosome partitioning ATPase